MPFDSDSHPAAYRRPMNTLNLLNEFKNGPPSAGIGESPAPAAELNKRPLTGPKFSIRATPRTRMGVMVNLVKSVVFTLSAILFAACEKESEAASPAKPGDSRERPGIAATKPHETKPQAESLKTFRSKKYGYSISYGNEWSRNDAAAAARTRAAPGTVDLFLTLRPKDSTDFWVTVTKYPFDETELDHDTALAWEEATLSFPGARKIESTSTKVSGRTAHRLVYEVSGLGVRRDFISIMTLHDRKMFVFFGSRDSDTDGMSVLSQRISALLKRSRFPDK